MEYSRIVSVELVNFMSFRKAKISFDDSGIINIKGYNDSGKSAILRGIAVCLMDMFRRSQLRFIRHGEEYFRVVVSFSDGVSVLRDKYITGQSLYEMYRGSEVIFSTRQGSKLTRVDGVPRVIADYLGLCVTDSVYLNYQSCVDKLPVVDTSGSENYQMFHEVLRMEEIYRASNMINTDKNELGVEIANMERELQRDEVLLERCGDVSAEFIEVISGLEADSIKLNGRGNSLRGISSVLESYDSIVSIPSLACVDGSRLGALYSLRGILDRYSSFVSVPSLARVDGDRLEELYNIRSMLENYSNFVSVPSVARVGEGLVSRLDSLDRFRGIYSRLVGSCSSCSRLDSSIADIRSRLDSLVSEARARGIDFVRCDRCGNYTEVGGCVHE